MHGDISLYSLISPRCLPAQVSKVYARIVANVIVTPRRLLDEVTGAACAERGEVSENAARVREHCRRRTMEATEMMLDGSHGGGGGMVAGWPSEAAATSETASAAAKSASGTAAAASAAAASAAAASAAAASAAAASAAAASAPPGGISWLTLVKRTLELAGSLSVAIGTSAPSEPAVWDVAQEKACDKVCDLLPAALGGSTAYIKDALRLEETIQQRMAVLPPGDFESLLHAVFKDDEWKLFLVGGVLGAAIGVGQVYAFQAIGMG